MLQSGPRTLNGTRIIAGKVKVNKVRPPPPLSPTVSESLYGTEGVVAGFGKDN